MSQESKLGHSLHLWEVRDRGAEQGPLGLGGAGCGMLSVEGKRFGSPRQRFHLQLNYLMGWALWKVLQGVMWGLDASQLRKPKDDRYPNPLGDRAASRHHPTARGKSKHLLRERSMDSSPSPGETPRTPEEWAHIGKETETQDGHL